MFFQLDYLRVLTASFNFLENCFRNFPWLAVVISELKYKEIYSSNAWEFVERSWTWERNGPAGKTEPQGLKTLPFISCHIKDRIEVIHFHMKSRGVQGLVFVQITFEKGITNFYFNNGVVAIKMATANLQPLLAWNVSACLSIFMQCFFDKKRVFMKLTTLFNLSTRRVLAKLLVVPKSSIKIKVRLHGTLFLILVISAVCEI